MMLGRGLSCCLIPFMAQSRQTSTLSSLLCRTSLHSLRIKCPNQKKFRTFSHWTRAPLQKVPRGLHIAVTLKLRNIGFINCVLKSHTIKSGQVQCIRFFASRRPSSQSTDYAPVMYVVSVVIFMLGLAFAAVPLYRMFCNATGLGSSTAIVGHDSSKVETMNRVADRIIDVKFSADVHSKMKWNFQPQQPHVRVAPGETALAFFKAKNPTDKPIIGIATYNVLPFVAGLYFNKIQCFCFEEQILNPHEEVDMPVFFYIDPDFANDPALADVDTIFLNYTFFEAKEGLDIPLPGFMRAAPSHLKPQSQAQSQPQAQPLAQAQ